MKATEKLIAIFHIGKGGRFNNPGHLTFQKLGKIGESNNFNDLYFDEEEKEYSDGVSLVGLTEEDVECGIGRINIDKEYNTTYSKYVDELDYWEWKALIEDGDDYEKEEALLAIGKTENECKLAKKFDDWKELSEYPNGDLYIKERYREITEDEWRERCGTYRIDDKYYEKR